MIGKIKREIREYLTAKYDILYWHKLQEEVSTYDSWIREEEKAKNQILWDLEQKESVKKEKTLLLSYASLRMLDNASQRLAEEGATKEYVILAQDKGTVSEKTIRKIIKIFEEKPEVEVLYTDEDEYNHEETVRMNPWLKPDFSPQTLLSFFYFGNLVAIRKSRMQEAISGLEKKRSEKHTEMKSFKEDRVSYQRVLYALILEICTDLKREQVFHIQETLYSSHNIKYWGFEEEYQDIRQYYDSLQIREKTEGVSIIIPSKDNPKILERCLKSVRQWTKETDYEIWVVDNGSSADNKEKIEKLKVEYKFNFLYIPMEFNFSKMCNLGAKQARYDMLLFLNDDCEVRGSKWLSQMRTLAEVKTVGAVGAKLYYPDSKCLQHCGIYNLHMGPVHKLQFKEDGKIYYDRRNRDIRNVLAVTGACLMVRKEVFQKVKGFEETLQVAFNDVDFCFKLYEAGYDNCIHNEIHLWHHESLSRGNDESEEKWKRLMLEKKMLYERHRDIWEKDPYYHPWFTTEILDTGYSFCYEYPKKKEVDLESPIKLLQLPKGTRIEKCVVPMVEYAGNPEGWFLEKERIKRMKERRKEKETAYLQGNVVVLGSDNACYEKYIILRDEITGDLYEISPKWNYRPDVFCNLADQKNVELSGFSCLVDLSEMPEGKYELGFLVRDKISKQYLLRITARSIENGRNKL